MVQVGISPTTVTVAVQLDELLLLSVTVNVTVFDPISVQSKVEADTLKETVPQLSVLPLFTSSAVMVAEPFTNVTLTFSQTAWGASLSLTVTVNEQLVELFDASVTVQ